MEMHVTRRWCSSYNEVNQRCRGSRLPVASSMRSPRLHELHMRCQLHKLIGKLTTILTPSWTSCRGTSSTHFQSSVRALCDIAGAINMPEIVDDKSEHCVPFILDLIAKHLQRYQSIGEKAPPFFIGLNGVQGAGKTTLVGSKDSLICSRDSAELLFLFSRICSFMSLPVSKHLRPPVIW